MGKRITRATKMKVFINVLRETGNISAASRESGIAHSTAYLWRQKHQKFAEAWDRTIAQFADDLELKVIGRARDGVRNPIYQGGVEVGERIEYSPAREAFLLRALKPERYGPKTSDSDALAERVEVVFPPNGRD